MTAGQKELCLDCHRMFAVTAAGRLRAHDHGGQRCAGSGAAARRVKPAPAANTFATVANRAEVDRSMTARPPGADDPLPVVGLDISPKKLLVELAEGDAQDAHPKRKVETTVPLDEYVDPFHQPAPRDFEWEAETGHQADIDGAHPGKASAVTADDAELPFTQPGKPEKRKRAPLTGDAAMVASQIREVFWQAVNTERRTQQASIGPSEIGHVCDRRISYKLAGQPVVNHRHDGWSAWVGTQIHRGIEEMFRSADRGRGRYLVDDSVVIRPPLVPRGTLDRADRVLSMILDDKAVGGSSLSKMWLDGPSTQYQVQLHTYAYGKELAGERFDKVALVAWPRESGNLDDLYVWVADYDRSVAESALARVEMLAGALKVRPAWEAPATRSFLCGWCPFHLPDSPHGRLGCPDKE